VLKCPARERSVLRCDRGGGSFDRSRRATTKQAQHLERRLDVSGCVPHDLRHQLRRLIRRRGKLAGQWTPDLEPLPVAVERRFWARSKFNRRGTGDQDNP
jgi:hypothetical protein